jgi:hypothetical protein
MAEEFKWPAFTVQVPVFNTGQYLKPLLDSLIESGWTDHVGEINLINDASTDNTADEIRRLQATHPLGGKVNFIDLKENIGRFQITIEGARRAKCEWVLYLNSRSRTRAGFQTAIERTIRAGATISAIVDVDIERSLFNLYWDRLHKIVFVDYMKAVRTPVEVTKENFEKLLVGATAMVARRQVVLDAFARLGKANVLGDDTTFLREMLNGAPLFLDPGFRILWTPRTDLWPFLHHMYERGPNFVEYHIFLMRDRFTPVVLAVLAYLVTAVVMLAAKPATGSFMIAAGLTAGLLSTAIISRSPGEFIRLMPLHLATLLFFGCGVLKGLATRLNVWISALKRRLGGRG